MRYLVDTDWVIDHLHGREPVVRRLELLAPQGLGMSIVSLAELYEGVFYSTSPQENEEALHNFLESVDILYLEDGVCRIFARERGRLRAAGMVIGDFDILIGSTAIYYELTLLTNNRRHFGRMDDLSIIST
jgi:tRNA(fMet)-specific endonuclease VapC